MKIDLPFIVFEIISRCNLDCRYCYNIWKNDSFRYPEFSYSYKKAIKVLKKLFRSAHVNHITFSGGEPLLAKRLSEIVLLCRLKKKTVSLISNGNAGSKEDYSTLIDLGASLFEFPVHSYKPEVHDTMTRCKGSWEKSVQSINDVLLNNGKAVAVIVLTKFNGKDVKNTLLFLKDLGINRIMLNRFNIGGEGISECDNLLLPIEDLKSAFKSANSIALKHNLSLSSNVCTPICVLNPKDFPKIMFSLCSSEINKRALTIDIEGNLRICNHSPVIIGNIFENTINEIIKSDYVKSWNEVIPDYCGKCNDYYRCKAGCRAASEQIGFSPKRVDPIIDKLIL